MRAHRSTFTVATINDNYNSPKSNVPLVKADVLLAQEVKFENVDRQLGKKYGVHQNLANEGKQGTAVAWNKDKFDAGKRGYSLMVTPHGHDLLNRYVNFTDVTIDGKQVRMASVHRPPKGDRALWPLFDKHLAQFVKSHEGPIVIGMDANQEHPHALAEKLGLRWIAPGPNSIDGFMVSKGIHVEHHADGSRKIHTMKKRSSDHKPVIATFSVRTPRKDVR